MRLGTILVAEDDKSIRTVLTQALTRQGYHVRATGNGTTLWKWVQEGAGDLIVTDVMMPDINGLDLLPRIRHIRPDIPIIVMSAQNTLMTAVTATERGAFEYLPKPFDLNELTAIVSQCLDHPKPSEKEREGSEKSAISKPDQRAMPLVGRSPAMQEVYRIIARVVANPINVMLHGEPGTGKELVARTIHTLSGGRADNFVVANLGGLSPKAVDEALLGVHDEGKIGLFSRAKGGTLFLNEVSEFSLNTQARLLEMLQANGRYSAPVSTNDFSHCRIVSSSYRNIFKAAESEHFRADLLYRLNELSLHLPPLRDRSGDISELTDHFVLENVNAQASGAEAPISPSRVFDKDAKQAMMEHNWPGNVRELRNFVKRLLILYSHSEINQSIVRREMATMTLVAAPVAAHTKGMRGGGGAFDDTMAPSAVPMSNHASLERTHSLSTGDEPGSVGNKLDKLQQFVRQQVLDYCQSFEGDLPPPGLYHRVLRKLEKPLFELSLDITKGNQIKAAELLGLNRNTVRKKIRDLEIDIVRGIGNSTNSKL